VEALTPAERRGTLLVALLLALGAAHDLWRVSRPLPRPDPHGAATRVVDEGPREGPGAGLGALRDTSRDHADPGKPPSTIDLNRASAHDLDALPGVGPVLAARIIAAREERGGYRRVDELMAVRGIGPRLYARLLPYVGVGSSTPPPDARPAPPPVDRRIGQHER
jgi:competence protein ComEA